MMPVKLVNPAALLVPGAPSLSTPNIVEETPTWTANKPEEPLAMFPHPQFTFPPPKLKTAEEIEYDQKVAAFLQKTSKKDDLDKKIDQHLEGKTGRKRKTFTDFPVPSSSSRGN